MSFWYYANQQARPTSIWRGEEPHWYDGLHHAATAISETGRGFDLFWIVDGPARLISGLAMLAYIILAFSAALFLAFKAGEWITDRTHKTIGIAGGILVWLYVGGVLYRAQHWFAFALLNND